MFTSYPNYSTFRTLFVTKPMMRGEDVFALQTALKALGRDPGDLDGILGDATSKCIWLIQGDLGIVLDGRAGGETQTNICAIFTNGSTNRFAQFPDSPSSKYNLPLLLMFGQVMHESSCRVGMYSPLRNDGSYDAGVTQRNTAHTSPQDGFNVPASMEALGSNTRNYFNKFEGVSAMRRWQLAAGAWNAPAYACWIAKYENGATKVRGSETARPGPTARAAFEEYVSSATALMVL